MLVCLCIGALILSFRLSYNRDKKAPVDDIGFWWLLYLNLYTTFPSIVWLLGGGTFKGSGVSRLLESDPGPGDVMYLQGIAVCYAVSFLLVYWLLVRRSMRNPVNPEVTFISDSKMTATIFIVLVTFGISLICNAVLFGSASNYASHYRIIASLPLFLAQGLKIVNGVANVSLIVMLVAILQRWSYRLSSRRLVVLYVIAALLSFNPSGSRGQIAIMLFALAIGWHVLVKPISTSKWFVGGVLAITVFLFFGALRGLGGLGAIANLQMAHIGLGEFGQVYANSVKLLQVTMPAHSIVPDNIRFEELWSWVPSQLLPFQKESLSVWFLSTFYPAYKASGGGMAFGAVSQAVIGGGLIEAVCRGAILGGLAGLLFRKYRSLTQSKWWFFPVYLYLTIFSLNTVRESTFSLLTYLVQLVLPSLILITILGLVLKKE